MNENQTKQLVCVAAVAGAFGVKGEVKIKPFTDDPRACVRYGPLMNDQGRIILTITSSRQVKTMLAVKTKEITSREQAEALKSTKLYVLRDALPTPDEDEFYYTDLIGLRVETRDGKDCGRVKAVHDFGGGDMLEIQKKGEKDWYHPFSKDAVPVVDVKGGRVIVEIIEADEEES